MLARPVELAVLLGVRPVKLELGVHMTARFQSLIILCIPALTLVSMPANADITGEPRIVDGDTIVISNERIRLHGIDAPESKQSCTMNGKEWACGQEATKALVRYIGDQDVTCEGDKRDRYKRLIAVCFAGAHNLNAKMVSEGWALAYRKYSKDYIVDEKQAKLTRRGIWMGEFLMPWVWRRR
jgi:endonuclease YncB( thermonuclease family)